MQKHLKNNEALSDHEPENWAVLLEIEREKQRRDQYGDRPMLEIPRVPFEEAHEKERSPSQGGNVEIISI